MALVRRGEVFISPADPVPADGSMVDPSSSEFNVSWQDEGESWPLEDALVRGAEAAIAWGRERSAVVWIRLGNRGDTYFSAGAEHPADDDPEEVVPHWPPAGPPADGWWSLPPMPTLADIEAIAAAVRAKSMTEEAAARWADERLSALVRWGVTPDRGLMQALVDLRGDWQLPWSGSGV
jgi:hypothetical protein